MTRRTRRWSPAPGSSRGRINRIDPRASADGQHTGVSLYDKIAHLYDPWSASVVEDIEFYVEEARRSGGPGGRARRRHGADRGADRGRRDRGDRRRLLGGDARGRARARPSSRASRSTCASATCATRRSRGTFPLVIDRRSARCCTWRPTPTGAPRCARCTGCSSPAGGSSSTSSRPAPRRHRRDARPLARARAGHLRARRLGRGGRRTLVLSVRGRGAEIGAQPRLGLGRRVARAARRGGLRRRGPLRLVRPHARGADTRTRSGSAGGD